MVLLLTYRSVVIAGRGFGISIEVNVGSSSFLLLRNPFCFGVASPAQVDRDLQWGVFGIGSIFRVGNLGAKSKWCSKEIAEMHHKTGFRNKFWKKGKKKSPLVFPCPPQTGRQRCPEQSSSSVSSATSLFLGGARATDQRLLMSIALGFPFPSLFRLL
jgi:hypothetical protein